MGPNSIENCARTILRLALMRQDRKLSFLHPGDVQGASRVTLDCVLLVGCALAAYCRHIRFQAGRLWPEGGKDSEVVAALGLRRLIRCFLGLMILIAAVERCAVTLIVARHILGTLPRQDAGEFGAVGKVVPAVIELHTVAVARQGDIGRMAVQARRCQHMDPINRHALRLVYGGGITVIEIGIVLEVERHGPAGVEPHGHMFGVHCLDDAKRTILDAQTAIVLQEHDAVAGREDTVAALDRNADVFAQCACLAQLCAGKVIERANLFIGVGQDDAGFVRCRTAVPIPAFD